MVISLVESCTLNDAESQVQVLIKAINIISDLTLNVELVSTKQNDIDQDDKNDCLKFMNSNTARQDDQALLLLLDTMQSYWKLEETGIPRLLNNLHSLKSQVQTYHQEIEQQVKDIHALQSKIEDQNSLKRVVAKLSRKNRRLQTKLTECRVRNLGYGEILNKLSRKVQIQKDRNRQLAELNCYYKQEAHESILRKEFLPSRTRCSFSTSTDVDDSETDDNNELGCSTKHSIGERIASGFVKKGDNRKRTETSDSASSRTTTTTVLSSLSGSDQFSTPTSTSSLITDDGVCTLRFESDRSARALLPSYTLTFCRGDKLGLKIRPIPFDLTPKSQRDTNMDYGVNCFSAKSTNVAAGLKGMVSEGGSIQNTLLHDHQLDGQGSESLLSTLCKDAQEEIPISALPRPHLAQSAFTNPFASFLGRSGGVGFASNSASEQPSLPINLESEQSEAANVSKLSTSIVFSYKQPHAFVVCGYQNYDSSAHPDPPSIGARIVAVNGHKVSDTWTMTEFTRHLRGTQMDHDDCNYKRDYYDLKSDHNEDENLSASNICSITFRDDPLNDEQWEVVRLSAKIFSQKYIFRTGEEISSVVKEEQDTFLFKSNNSILVSADSNNIEKKYTGMRQVANAIAALATPIRAPSTLTVSTNTSDAGVERESTPSILPSVHSELPPIVLFVSAGKRVESDLLDKVDKSGKEGCPSDVQENANSIKFTNMSTKAEQSLPKGHKEDTSSSFKGGFSIWNMLGASNVDNVKKLF